MYAGDVLLLPHPSACQWIFPVNVAVDGPAIRVESLYKGFGGPPVLRGLALEVAWGGALVIFGTNGSGKTTLLRLLATLYKPDRGSISLAGLETRRSAASIRRLIGVVGHQPMLYQNMTCEENLTFFGRMYGLENVGGRVDGVLTQMGLEARRLQRVRTLSHGMQKRLAMARAVLHDPPILLMDEPESGLDQGALEGMESLREMNSGRPSHRGRGHPQRGVGSGLGRERRCTPRRQHCL